MFTINHMPEQLDLSLVKMLERVETATIGHFRYEAFAHRSITPVLSERRVAGTAVTVRIPHADSTMLLYLTKLVRPGDFVVVDRCGDDKYACWGGSVSYAMHAAGIAGGIIDGPATDLSEIRKLDLPIWCRGFSPITTRMLGEFGEINVPVNIGGKTVYPGDAVLADESGIVILRPSDATAVATEALAMQEMEVAMLPRLRQGENLSDISGATQLVEGALSTENAA